MINIVNEAINRKLASLSFTNIITGKVESVNPLQIRINDKIVIGQSFIEPMSLGLNDYSPSSALPLIVGETIQLIRYNNGQRFYILGKTGIAKADEVIVDYKQQVASKPIINTTATQKLDPVEIPIEDEVVLHKVSRTGSYLDLLDKPNLAKVATSGKYEDLDGIPEIPTNLVTTDGEQNISGKKIFESLPETNTRPTNNNQFVNKSYVDAQIKNSITGDTLPIGTQIPYAGIDIPVNWLVCDGSEISRTEYADLFNVIGTFYGAGDGSTTFNLPDKRGRTSVGVNPSDIDFDTPGKKYGEKEHTLTAYEMPSHSHSVKLNVPFGMPYNDKTGASANNGGNVHYGESYSPITIQNAGGGQAHNNMPPVEVDTWIIKAFQSAGVIANITNEKNDSLVDTYSCDYINKIKENLEKNNETLNQNINAISNNYVMSSYEDVTVNFSKTWTWYTISPVITIPSNGVYLVMYSAWLRGIVDFIGEVDLAFEINKGGYRRPRGTGSGGSANCNEILTLSKGDTVSVIAQMNKTGNVGASNNSLIAIKLI